MTRALVVRTDNDGDVLLAGPAVRAVAARAEVTLLVSRAGAQAAALLPGVRDVVVFDPPWSGYQPPAVDPAAVHALVGDLAARSLDEAVVLTSFHQSPLPMALLLRLAAVPRVGAISTDYPGSLLDVRHRVDEDLHEVERALSLTAACGFPLPAADDGRLRVRDRLPDVRHLLDADASYVVVHPSASVPARAPSPGWSRRLVAALAAEGWPVVVTGGPGDEDLTAYVAGSDALDLGGRTSYAELATVLAGAEAVVVGNTGPAHLAAAVGTPVVSLFSPVVPPLRWAPYGVPLVVLGDQDAACRGTRARQCPVPGHPCLDGVPVADVLAALDKVTGVTA